MQIKRKTKSEFKPFKARLLVYPETTATTGNSGTENPAAAMHRFGIGEGELHANVDDNAKFGDQIVPQLTIAVPGFGELIVSPGEVHRLLIMIEETQAKARHAATYVGRECTVSGTV
jgi:hypothetical protein